MQAQLTKIWKYLHVHFPLQVHISLLLFLTVVLWMIGDIFSIPGVLEHPQFENTLELESVKWLLDRESWRKSPFIIFFVLDFFWAPLLVLAIWRFIYRQKEIDKTSIKNDLFTVLTFVAIAALIMDYLENIYYLQMYNPKIISSVKEGLYGMVFLVFLVVFAHFAVKNYVQTLFTFLKSAAYSLVILIIIGILLPEAPQVNSIVVNLYEHPINLAILLLVTPIFAVVLAHYPSYFNIDENIRSWYMGEKKFGLLGTVFYKYNVGYGSTDTGKKEGHINFLLRSLGILFYVSLFYLLGYTSEINFDWSFRAAQLTSFTLLIGLIWLYHLKKKKDKWFAEVMPYISQELPGFYDGDYSRQGARPQADKNEVTCCLSCGRTKEGFYHQFKNLDKDDLSRKAKSKDNSKDEGIYCAFCSKPNPAKQTEMMPQIEKYTAILSGVKQFVWIFMTTLVFHIILFLSFYFIEENYSMTTVVLSLACVFLQMISFVYYRTYRSVLRFAFFYQPYRAVRSAFYILRPIHEIKQDGSEGVDNDFGCKPKKPRLLDLKDKEDAIFDFFEEQPLVLNGWGYRILAKLGLGALSNNIVFLQSTVAVGIFNACFFVLINIFGVWSLEFNPILIILSALFLYYGFVVVITKNLIYYKYSKEIFAKKNARTFRYLVYAGVVVAILAFGFTKKYSNNLFTLTPIDREINNEIGLREYVDYLPGNETRYYIGCYGGGMKSNAWTMTVLKELYDRDNDFFKKTVGISGASGGTMGLVNMATLMHEIPDTNDLRDTIIQDISTENILSMDLTHILGRDSFSYFFVPGADLKGTDRSSKAMDRYAFLTNNHDQICKPKSFRGYWTEMYKKNRNRFPILVSNSTNVIGNQGMAVSVAVKDSVARDLLYHGADDILEISSNDDNDATEMPKLKTLSFYDAASTSNRFPFISPAAKIETKGNYNDGGIYENSGMLSVYKLFKAVNELECIYDMDSLKQRNVFISIVNDKNQYIAHRLGDKLPAVNQVNSAAGIAAILSSVVATEMLPIYVKTRLRQLSKSNSSKVEFWTIYLPHRFTVADVRSILGNELDDGTGVNQTILNQYKNANKNDSTIRSHVEERKVGWTPIIEPPMSRVMAEPAYEFMRQMLKHPNTGKALDSILRK